MNLMNFEASNSIGLLCLAFMPELSKMINNINNAFMLLDSRRDLLFEYK